MFDNIPYLNAALRYVKKRAGVGEPLVTKDETESSLDMDKIRELTHRDDEDKEK